VRDVDLLQSPPVRIFTAFAWALPRWWRGQAKNRGIVPSRRSTLAQAALATPTTAAEDGRARHGRTRRAKSAALYDSSAERTIVKRAPPAGGDAESWAASNAFGSASLATARPLCRHHSRGAGRDVEVTGAAARGDYRPDRCKSPDRGRRRMPSFRSTSAGQTRNRPVTNGADDGHARDRDRAAVDPGLSTR
jgi:hypothetical protein